MTVPYSLRQRVQIELGTFEYTFMVPDHEQHAEAYRRQERWNAIPSDKVCSDDIVSYQVDASNMVKRLVVDVTCNGEPVEDWKGKLETDDPFAGQRGVEVLAILYFQNPVVARVKSGGGSGGPEARRGSSVGEVAG
jgi:hypothetical protein